MPLPTAKTPIKTDIHDLTVLLYGPAKIGKSTFCSQADSAVFLATEPGLNTLEVYQQPVTKWEELLAACLELAAGSHPFRTVVIDTVDNAYRMCSEFICKKHKVEHESEMDYGKGFSLVNSEFQRVLTKLSFLPYGLVLVSHSQDKEVETRTGKIIKSIPTLPEKARRIVLGLVDVILYADLETVSNGDGKATTRRVLRTKPSPNYEAGDRTGRLPEVIDLSFAKFAECFPSPVPPVDPKTVKPKTQTAAPAAQSK